MCLGKPVFSAFSHDASQVQYFCFWSSITRHPCALPLDSWDLNLWTRNANTCGSPLDKA